MTTVGDLGPTPQARDVTEANATGRARLFARSAIDAAPASLALRWNGNVPSLLPLENDVYRACAAETPERFIAIADAGVWIGREDHPSYCRSFVALCGRTLAVCEFTNEAILDEADAFDVEDRDEWHALHAVLRGLAGPQRIDVQVLRVLHNPAPLEDGPVDRTVWIFLPDMHLPLVPPMPELPTDLVPDPTRATCFCHGPVMARILGKSAAVPASYSAVGTAIGRDPNEWFYLMAENYRPVADDLVKFLGRFQKVAQRSAVHLVQMGGLFEVWAGFDVTFAASGRAGQILPKIVRGVHLENFRSNWFERVRDTASRRAVVQMSRVPATLRTVLQDDPAYFARGVPPSETVAERPSLRVGSLFHAEHHPTGFPFRRDAPPIGFVALIEQGARFLPWQRTLSDGFRTDLTAWRIESLLASAEHRPPGAAVTAHTHVPFLANVMW